MRGEAPGYVYELARQLRQRQTPAEELLWQCLRNRQLDGLKFRRGSRAGCYADVCCCELQRDGDHGLDVDRHNDADHHYCCRHDG